MSWPRRVTDEQLNKADAERLRDTFAAAALTGLLSNIPRYQLGVIAVQAYDIADEMLRERLRHGVAESRETAKQLKDAEDFVAIREQFLAWQKEQSVGVAEMDSVADRKSVATPRACARSCRQPFDSAPTTHDAVPEAKATNDGGTPKDADGTGNTPSEAEIDALEFVVEEGRTASVDDYGILRSWLIRLRPEWESQSYEESNEKRANANTNRDTTPGEGSVQGECAVSHEERAAILAAADLMIGSRPGATLRSLLTRLK